MMEGIFERRAVRAGMLWSAAARRRAEVVVGDGGVMWEAIV